MESDVNHSFKYKLADPKVPVIEHIKSSFQSQSVVLNDMIHPFQKSVYGQFDFDEFLIDCNGHYWFTEKNSTNKKTTQIYIFSENGHLLKNFSVLGKPTLYENEGLLIAACEGRDDKGYVYLFCKNYLSLIDEWTIDGFLWDMECIGNTFYITSYYVENNEAMLYIINDSGKKVIKLGQDMFPTGILCHRNKLFISLSYFKDGDKGKVVQSDLNGVVVNEIEVAIAPRKLYGYQDELIIHGMDMAKGCANKLVYINVDTQHQEVYQSPRAADARIQGKYMLFYNQETESIIYWSHEKRKIMRVVHRTGQHFDYYPKKVKLNH